MYVHTRSEMTKRGKGIAHKVLLKQADCKFKDKPDSLLWGQISMISVTWLCFSNPKGQHTWSHSFPLAKNASCFHLWLFHKLEFALSSLQNTPLKYDHIRSPFLFDKQSHTTKTIDIGCQIQPPCLPLNLRSTYF